MTRTVAPPETMTARETTYVAAVACAMKLLRDTVAALRKAEGLGKQIDNERLLRSFDGLGPMAWIIEEYTDGMDSVAPFESIVASGVHDSMFRRLELDPTMP